MKRKYRIAKSAGVREVVECPSCGTLFTKITKGQAFCRTMGGTVCKDKYWNTVIPTKRNNTNRISPANYSYYKDVIEKRQFFEAYDPGDSEYWDNKDY